MSAIMQLIFGLLLFVSVGLNTMAQILLKTGANQSLLNFHVLGGIVVYGLAAIAYIVVLGKFNLSLAYPILVGLSAVATTVAGAILFREKISMVNWFGVGLTISGIFAISLGRSS
jgi:multidrug transporter EmrE-like cation transporter